MKAPPARARSMPTDIVRAGQEKPRPAFQLFDPRQRFFREPPQPKTARPQPRIGFFRDGEYRTVSFAPEPPRPSDGMENPANLQRRLQALKAALDDLPGQAKRLARALARRQKSPRLKLKMPMRPGRAPGYRVKPRLDIDHVLHQCDWLAREALAPDTS